MISEPDFYALEQIIDALAGVPLQGLVGAFGRRAGGAPLLVHLMATPAPGRPAVTLDTLPEADLTEYDGLFVGFSALDVVRPDLLTKGPGFHPLEWIFLERNARDALLQTQRDLALHLLALAERLPPESATRRQRARTKALVLALASLIQERGLQNLVAVLPGDDLAGFVCGRGGRWLRTDDDLAGLDPLWEGDWVIAPEDLRCLFPQVSPDSPHSLDLHIILKRPEYEIYRTTESGRAELRRMWCSLAELCLSSCPEAPEAAWGLLAEAALIGEDAEDLVAYFPHGDFDVFAETGKALRVYRALPADIPDDDRGPRWSLTQLAANELPAEFGRYGFTLCPLEPSVWPAAGRVPLLDLGLPLVHVGHDISLTRTLCALALDGLEAIAPTSYLSGQTLADLAGRATLLASLGNPWHWPKGHYDGQVTAAYRALTEALKRLASADPTGNYYKGLAEWYGCATLTEPTRLVEQLRRMTTAMRDFLRATSGQAEEHRAKRIAAEELIAVEQAVLYPESGLAEGVTAHLSPIETPSPDERGRLYQQAAGAGIGIPPTKIFRRAWREAAALRRERQQVSMFVRDAESLGQRLTDLQKRVQTQRRPVFAPPHEMAVLRHLYDLEETLIAARLTELRNEARLELTALNTGLEYGRPVVLTLEVSNAGRMPAHEVALVLHLGPTFEPLDPSPVRSFATLEPGQPQRATYLLRAMHPQEVYLEYRYTYAGLGRELQVDVRLPVSRPEERPFEVIRNPYKFGRFIEEPQDFFGREMEMRKLLGELASGGHASWVLRGPRRMGKSSLLQMLDLALQQPSLRRRFGVPTDWDTGLDSYHAIKLDVQAHPTDSEQMHIRQFFQALLDKVATAVAPDLRVELLGAFEGRAKEVGVPSAVLEQLERVFQARPHAHVVVLLDEFDELYRVEERDLNMALRHVVQFEQRIAWVIASTQFLYREGKSYGSPWFNILHTQELDRLDRGAARQLVEVPGRKAGIEWQSDAVTALLDETGRHPFYLQIFCSMVVDYLNQEHRNYVLPDTIALLSEQLVAEPVPQANNHFEFYWGDTPGVGRLLLLAVDSSEQPPTLADLRQRVFTQLAEHFGARPETRTPDAQGNARPWREAALDNGLKWTAEVVNALAFNEITRTYSFNVPLVRRWLQRRARREDLHSSALHEVAEEMTRDGIV